MKSIEPQQSIASATYGDLATVGPTVVIPRAGYYNVGLGCESYSGNAGENGIMSYSIGATAAVDADGMVGLNFNVVNYLSRRVGLKLFATGGISLVAKYRCNNGASTNFYAKRHLSVIPVRVA
jgi:hypothetical protein